MVLLAGRGIPIRRVFSELHRRHASGPAGVRGRAPHAPPARSRRSSLAAACAATSGIDNGTFRSAKGYRLDVPRDGWRVEQGAGADLALARAEPPAGMLADATCDGREMGRDLPVLARHLTFGLTDRRTVESDTWTVGGRDAAHRVVMGRRDGAEVGVEAVVMKGDRCVHDFLYVAPAASFEAGRAGLPRLRRELRGDAVTLAEYARKEGREALVWYGGLGLLAVRVCRNLALPPAYVWLVAREIDMIGVRSLVVALTAALFTGMVLALQSAVNMARFGAENYVGPVVALSILRELGPVLTAILVGGKVASGITAELGSMKVTEQIDALRALGVNYVKRLIVPRILAALLVFPVVTVLSDGVGLLGGMLVSVFDRSVDAYLYWNTISYWVVMKDFLTGIAKSVVFGFIVTMIGCYNGLATEAGRRGWGARRRPRWCRSRWA